LYDFAISSVKVKQSCPATPCTWQGGEEYSCYPFLTSQ
jgi:hypothetical protein